MSLQILSLFLLLEFVTRSTELLERDQRLDHDLREQNSAEMTDVQQQQPEPSATGGEKVETDFPLRFCTVCASNQNRFVYLAMQSLSLSVVRSLEYHFLLSAFLVMCVRVCVFSYRVCLDWIDKCP